MMNKPWPSFLDGVGNGLGYALILVIVGAVREFLGRGSLLGFQLIPEGAYNSGYVKQRYDDHASHGIDSRWMCNLGTSCLYL